jgi:hypothetical protein
MDEQIVETAAPEQVTVTEIGVNVTKVVDLGYTEEYLSFVKDLVARGKPVPFGTRDNGKNELSMWAKAQVPASVDPQAALKDLANRVEAIVNEQLLIQGVRVDDPDAAMFITTNVNAQIGGNEAW